MKRRTRIGTRLGIAFGATLVLMVAIVLVGTQGLSRVGDSLDGVIKNRYAKLKLIKHIDDAINQQARSARNSLLFDEQDKRNQQLSVVEEAGASNKQRFIDLEALVVERESAPLLADIADKRRAFSDELVRFERLVLEGDVPAAKKDLLDRLRPLQLSFMKALDALANREEAAMDSAGKGAIRQVQTSTTWMIVVASVAVALAAIAGWHVSRSITGPINRAMEALKRVEGGDLSEDLSSDDEDEPGQMLAALGRSIGALRAFITEVREGMMLVHATSLKVAKGSTNLSERTEKQASALEETAASMEQINATVTTSVGHAAEANSSAQAASESAEKGGLVVEQVVASMRDISAASQKISEIVGVIDSFAFQTSILALNAAVEAARAGEHGRGFAVVAAEIRNLAQRSTDAAGEIKTLIHDSAVRVQQGCGQVATAGEAMRAIVAQVKQVDALIRQISHASREQSNGISQVSQAIAEMDQVTQQNASLVDESASAARTLREQAASLAREVAAFKTEA